MAEAMPSKPNPPKGLLPPDPLFILKGDMAHIHSLCFSTREYMSTCSMLLASSEDGWVHFWNLDTNRRSHKQNMGSSIIAIHSIEDNLITQEKSGLVKLWNLKKSNYSEIKTMNTYGGFCKSLLVNKTELIVPQEDSKLDVINVKDMEKTRTLIPEADNLGMCMCLNKIDINGKYFILGAYESGQTILWDLETAKKVAQLQLKQETTSLSFDPATGKGVAGNSSNTVQVFQIDRNDLEMSLKYETNITNEGINVVEIREDGKVFVAGCWDNKIRYFSWRTLRVLAVLNEHRLPITDIKFSPFPVIQWNTPIMAAASQDGSISLWNLYL